MEKGGDRNNKEHPRSQEPVQATPTRPVDCVEAIRIEVPKTPPGDTSEENDDSTLVQVSPTPVTSETAVASLPPRPPPSSLSIPASGSVSKHLSPVARARLIAAKKQFLAQQAAAAQAGAGMSSNSKTSPSKQPPVTAEEAAKSSENLRQAFERFRQKAEEDRRRLARSVPDSS